MADLTPQQKQIMEGLMSVGVDRETAFRSILLIPGGTTAVNFTPDDTRFAPTPSGRIEPGGVRFITEPPGDRFEGLGVVQRETEPPPSRFQGSDFVQPVDETNQTNQTTTPHFIQSGTGKRFTKEQIQALGEFPPGTFFLEEGTGRSMTPEDFGIQTVEQEPETPQRSPEDDRNDALVNNLPPELASLYRKVEEYIDGLIKSGKKVNPNITIDKNTLDRFLSQAEEEFAPFFSGEEKAVLTDLKRSLQRGAQLQTQTEEDLEREKEQGFESIAETAAEQGIALSGVRREAERDFGESISRSISRGREGLAFGAETASLGAEREIGSTALEGFNFPNKLGRVTGGIFGRIPGERETAIRTRQAELETSERRRRLLDLQGT